MLPHGRASCFAGFASFQGRHLAGGGGRLVGVHGVVVARARVASLRLRSVEFACDRERLASGLPHGLVLAPGAQGGLVRRGSNLRETLSRRGYSVRDEGGVQGEEARREAT